MDVAMMKRLHDKLNIVPVIAKADTLTKTELNKLKSKVSGAYYMYTLLIKLRNNDLEARR